MGTTSLLRLRGSSILFFCVLGIHQEQLTDFFATLPFTFSFFGPLLRHLCQHKPSFIITQLDLMLSIRSLIILMAVPSALTYATSSPVTKPAFGLLKLEHASAAPIQKYDLGLGKNAPLNPSSTPQSLDVQTASQFWIAPEPARTYPSPTSNLHMETEIDANKSRPTPANKSKPTPIVPRRQSEDVLHIMEDRTILPSSSAQLDLNTVWVEMLIHDQTLAYAYTNC